jgi:3-phosphoshikimate 1-carboxyvinyltransferase
MLFIASAAEGVSRIRFPLDSTDTLSCVSVCRGLSASITEERSIDALFSNPTDKNGKKLTGFTVCGGFGKNRHITRLRTLDAGNSGTTLFFALAMAGLQSSPVCFTGDEQTSRRSAAPLLNALSGAGVQITSNDGCTPITVQGPWKGGKVLLPCPTSQFLSAMLLAAPLAPADTVTEIEIPLLNEKPYVDMTLSYLKAHGVTFEMAADYSRFIIPGGGRWKPFENSVPGDFSSAAYIACAAAITGGPVTILGLDPKDTQGDKYFFEILDRMGCSVKCEQRCGYQRGGKEEKAEYHEHKKEWAVTVSRSSPLRGGVFDLNSAPDLLSAVAVTAAYANGDTAIVNAESARLKETDRIAVMCRELNRAGISCEERPDGLVIHGKGPQSFAANKHSLTINGHGDHRVVMAFAAAALGAGNPVEISDAERAAVTYPLFFETITR